MVRFRSACILTAALAAVPLVPLLAANDAAARWWAHVAFLADGALEGRDTGSDGHKKAAAYVALSLVLGLGGVWLGAAVARTAFD